ncbi:galactose mutarotase [Bacillus sp. ISL-35]|uniref:aldose epimerase family protein n=1 Tax=Bacillus sp. ISL-35 TaxID=2819122 RepID=UPI001BEA044D|nr:aldose epimerase family protein [Bacillus sp. ISL-35]MBT2678730.1 galactose mutarotase [Bacillus sp. ISL-35]MBT2703722.1 galactose mutarotase [Chryseobacterium sp. ISL-80]
MIRVTNELLGNWTEYTLTNDNGISVSVLDFGGIITKIMIPDKTGRLENIVLGYKNYQEYRTNPNYFGAIIGRVAGRIKEASFELDGSTYNLEANNGENHLHGGPGGFHQLIWKVSPFEKETEAGLKLTIKSHDGDSGYPGNLDVTVTYTLNDQDQLIIDYLATSDQTTPLTLTNHSYFNLSGNLKNTIHDHRVTMNSSKYVELDESLIPTGKLADVEGTPFDFRSGRSLSTGLENNFEQNKIVGNGYDHYFVLEDSSEFQAIIEDANSGRKMSVITNQPGMVMYTANALEDGLELAEGISRKHHGVCFETQGSPASLHNDHLPGILLKPGEPYQKQTTFTFTVIKR